MNAMKSSPSEANSAGVGFAMRALRFLLVFGTGSGIVNCWSKSSRCSLFMWLTLQLYT